ncbi:activating signal cointegrator 1 complex subunit 2 homolog [Patiria miniata]|uniref:Uncharacterized protein n=1 Tax=Patiria miniata TaxID=46514 RepID=A0A914BJQ0_PATMI|nr:activating signal cointegrator 1 complex subunit 2 homolog [Patiria miniata]
MTNDLNKTNLQTTTPIRGTTPAATVLPTVNTSTTPLDNMSTTGMIPSETTEGAIVLPIAIIAGAAGGGAALVLLLLILCICLCGCKCRKKRDQKPGLQEMSALSELIHEPSIEPHDFHQNIYSESTSSFKNGQHEMIEIDHNQSAYGLGTELLATPNLHTDTNRTVLINAPLQKKNSIHALEQAYNEISEFKEMPSFEAKSTVLETEDGQRHVADSPSEESDHKSSSPIYAEVQKNRASKADNPPVYAEVQKNRASLVDEKEEHENSGQLANPDNVSPPPPPPSSQPSPLPASSPEPPPHQQPPSQAKEQMSTPASSSELPPRPPSFIQRPTPQDEPQVNIQKDDHHEASANHQDPDENPASKEHEVMYAELDLEPDTSGKLPTPTEEPTMYATIKDMPK